MDLLSSSFSLFAVPTLDIDLAWHTHQLQSSYRIDTAKAVGRAIDHNDKVEETDLGYGFDDTAKLWEVSLPLTAMDSLVLTRLTAIGALQSSLSFLWMSSPSNLDF